MLVWACYRALGLDSNSVMKVFKMKINVVHCLFEQSGTFKNVFKSMGVPAYDYDLLNDFGETDFCNDLFWKSNVLTIFSPPYLICLIKMICSLRSSLAFVLRLKLSCALKACRNIVSVCPLHNSLIGLVAI